MTEIFSAVTNRRMAFYEEGARAGLAIDIAPQSRVIVTINHLEQHAMRAYVDGKSYLRHGSDYTRITGPLHPNDAGGTGLDTEYGEKVADLAFSLAKYAYPDMEAWGDVEPHYVDNYTADAEEIIRAYPHLLSLPERERLGLVYSEVAI